MAAWQWAAPQLFPASDPESQGHWLVNKAGGTPSYTKLDTDEEGDCIIYAGRVKNIHANKRKRYIWGNSWTTSKGTQSIFWITQHHGFLYECIPYSRDAHLAYANRLAWLIAANTWYIYLNGERFVIPQPEPERYLYIQSVVLGSYRTYTPEINDDPEWQYPSRRTRRNYPDYYNTVSPAVSPAASSSSLVGLPISKGSDTRSVCSESDVRDDRLGLKRIVCPFTYDNISR